MPALPIASVRSKKSARLVGFAAVALIAIIWNAVVLRVFHSVLLHGGGWDFVDWIIFMVLTPFALGGFGLLGYAIYLGVPLLNPRVVIEVNPPVATLGESIEVTWHFEGPVDQVPRLVIRLEAREQVLGRTGRGAAGVAEQHVFRRVGLIQATSREQIRSGSASLRIPADAMPSLNAGHSRIAWYICLHGGSDRWPNVRQELEMLVRPLPLIS